MALESNCFCLKYGHLDILFGMGLYCRTFVLIRVPAPINKVRTTGRAATIYKGAAECQRDTVHP